MSCSGPMKSVFEPCKEPLDCKPCLVVIAAVGVALIAVFPGISFWNAWRDAFVSQMTPGCRAAMAFACRT